MTGNSPKQLCLDSHQALAQSSELTSLHDVGCHADVTPRLTCPVCEICTCSPYCCVVPAASSTVVSAPAAFVASTEQAKKELSAHSLLQLVWCNDAGSAQALPPWTHFCAL